MASYKIETSHKNTSETSIVTEDKDFFQKWLTGKLQHYNADDEIFLPYIMSLLEEAEPSSTESDDVLDSLSDILEGLGLDEDCDNQENSLHLGKEIWAKWSKAISLESSEINKANGHGGNDRANEKIDIQTQLARITESKTEAYTASAKAASERHAKDEDERKAVKAAILAQYQNVGEEVSEESDQDDGNEDELTVMRNENKEAVAKAEQEKREKCRAAAIAKKEKDKEDREKQTKDQEDRKKKAQDKASKGERKSGR